MKPHIQVLLDAETETQCEYGGDIRFDRTGENTIVVSCSGYKHMDLSETVEKLIRLGCKYDFAKHERDLENFDKVCGRTFVYLIEPK
jgi:hypothetical protein